MLIYPSDRTALFIDGPNFCAMNKALGFETDFKRLLELFRERVRLVRALYYTVLFDDGPCQVRPLVDWLDYNGFTTVTKPLRERAMGNRQKSRMDIEIAVDAMQLAAELDHIVIASGNGDFRSLVAALQEKGKRVSILATLATRPSMVADELRRQADEFIDLVDLQEKVERRSRNSPAGGT